MRRSEIRFQMGGSTWLAAPHGPIPDIANFTFPTAARSIRAELGSFSRPNLGAYGGEAAETKVLIYDGVAAK